MKLWILLIFRQISIVGIFVTVPSLSVHNRGGANVGQNAEWAFAGFKLFFFNENVRRFISLSSNQLDELSLAVIFENSLLNLLTGDERLLHQLDDRLGETVRSLAMYLSGATKLDV